MIELINKIFEGTYHSYKISGNNFKCRAAFVGYAVYKGLSLKEISNLIKGNEDIVRYREKAHINLYNTDLKYRSDFDKLKEMPFIMGELKPTYNP